MTNKGEYSDVTGLQDQKDLSLQSLSRKKSEQRLSEIHRKLPGKPEEQKIKSTTTPPPQAKPDVISPFNTDNFFTQNFDDQEMEEAIEKLKNTSGKLGLPDTSEENRGKNLLIDSKKKNKEDLGSKTLGPEVTELPAPSPEEPADSKGESTLSEDLNVSLNKSGEQKLREVVDSGKDDYSLIKQVEKSKIVKVKDSRNSDIKESKNKDVLDNEELGESDKKKYFGISDDVEFLKRKNTVKTGAEESRNEKQVTVPQQIQVKSKESLKEDIILDTLSDKEISDFDDKLDAKNISGSRSLDEQKIITPDKAPSVKDTEFESSEKTDNMNNSDSKYATVSILSELNKKDSIEEAKRSKTALSKEQESLEIATANKLTDLIYSAMLAEIKAELFPPRPLFLLTADLDKIELEQAMMYLNDMSVEKEAALLKEYLKYSGGDDVDFGAWDDDKLGDSEDNKMFSDSGRLVLYERKGISTDLFSIERYVDELADEVDDKCKSKFLTDTFSPIKKDSMEMLNQLQNSDIGTYDHFETDLNSIAILPLEVYLELEKKRKSKDIEESKSDRSGSEDVNKTRQKELKLLKE